MSLFLLHVHGGDDSVDFFYGEYFRYLESYFGAFQQFARVGFQIVGNHQKVEEGLDSGEYPGLGAGMYADVVESCGEALQIIRRNIRNVYVLPVQKVQKFL